VEEICQKHLYDKIINKKKYDMQVRPLIPDSLHTGFKLKDEMVFVVTILERR